MAKGERIRKRTRAEIRETMIQNLEERGLVEPVYRDMVEDYMTLWDQRQALDDDIAERGPIVYDAKRGMLVDNISVSRRCQVSHQMLAIYRDLGLRDQAVKAKVQAEDDDDAL